MVEGELWSAAESISFVQQTLGAFMQDDSVNTPDRRSLNVSKNYPSLSLRIVQTVIRPKWSICHALKWTPPKLSTRMKEYQEIHMGYCSEWPKQEWPGQRLLLVGFTAVVWYKCSWNYAHPQNTHSTQNKTSSKPVGGGHLPKSETRRRLSVSSLRLVLISPWYFLVGTLYSACLWCEDGDFVWVCVSSDASVREFCSGLPLVTIGPPLRSVAHHSFVKMR